jgi:hypothetical protein
VQGGDDALGWIVEQGGADALQPCELKLVRLVRWQIAEKRLVLLDRLAFVVVDGPAAAHPAQRSRNAGDLFWLSLYLALDGATKAIRIGEGDLYLGLCAGWQIADVGLAYNGGGKGWILRPKSLIASLVIDDATGGVAQQVARQLVAGFSKKLSICAWVNWASKPAKRIAQVSLALPMTAVPATIPNTSKVAWLRLPLGSISRSGWRTR